MKDFDKKKNRVIGFLFNFTLTILNNAKIQLMKKLLIVLSFTLGLGFASAQTAASKQAPPPPPATKSMKQETPVKTAKTQAPAKSNTAIKTKKDGTPDKRYTANKQLKKDGTPDKRYKKK